MLTTSEAARLLAAAGHGAPLASLLAPLGFTRAVAIATPELARLGIRADPPRTSIAAAHGSQRALLLEWETGPPLRERLPSVARAVARAVPASHLLLIARHGERAELAFAAPSPDDRGALPALIVEAAHLRASDAETFAALAATDAREAPLLHLRWREVLGRDALSGRFYRDLEGAVGTLATTARGRADARDRRTVALLTASRLLFLAFLEAKGWLDRDRAFLRHQVERVAPLGELHATLLEPLCFGTLNTPLARRARAALAFGRVPFLNGGLFQRSGIERRCRALRLRDDAVAGLLLDLLPRYRLTAREGSAEISDAAVDPEMLGRAFESLMAAETRRTHGAFYTPQPLIARLADQAFSALGRHGDPDRTCTNRMIGLSSERTLRVLDPACGSGAFLVHALEMIAARCIARGDARTTSVVRREVLTRCIFGVDVDPVAVWLCQLRLWLSVVVEDERDDPMRLPPLPNLDRNVREGDALAGLAFEDAVIPDGASLAPLRLRYSRASGSRKRTLARTLDLQERKRAMLALSQRIASLRARRRELLIAARMPDLFRERRGPDGPTRRALGELRSALCTCRSALRKLADGGALPFSFATHFPEVAAAGGFDVVIGNPPWVRPHALAPEMRESLRARFFTARQAAWESGADSAGAGRGFASQADLSALFTERAVQLSRAGGVVALLLPAKLWSALAGGGVRRVLLERTQLLALDDWGDARSGFDAVVYPSSVVARRGPGGGAHTLRLTRHGDAEARTVALAASALAIDPSPGAPWLLLPPDVRAAFDAVERAGTALSTSRFGRPMLGVKSGCNDAFIVEAPPLRETSSDTLVAVRSGAATGELEGSLLRPLLRGEHVRAWTIAPDAATSAIVWTHAPQGTAHESLPPAARRWLLRWRRRLESRTDGRHARWWSLFRTESARNDRARVVWGDIGRAPRALVLKVGDRTVPLNTCYVVAAPSEEDAHALAALLNSRIAAAWLGVVAEPARGGYKRFLGWTCARLPLPRDWTGARALLAPLGRAAGEGTPPATGELDAAVLRAFALDAEAVAPLLAWSP